MRHPREARREKMPPDGARQEYQTELPPGLPPWSGSPSCFVAPAFEADTVITFGPDGTAGEGQPPKQ